MNDELFLPTISHWQFGNNWSGALGRACFWVTPKDGELEAEVWTGPRCREEGEAEHAAQFPLDEDGLTALRGWLILRAGEINEAAGAYRYDW